jgi:acyl-CoA synthetase (AMP-forming)/AMP-acid ligase II
MLAQRRKPVTGEEGWFRTGDLGTMDEEGNLYFKGRNRSVMSAGRVELSGRPERPAQAATGA